MKLERHSRPIRIGGDRAIAAEWGSLEVPVTWEQPDEGRFKIAFVRIPGSRPDHPQATFFLPGGPGFAQLRSLPFVVTKFRPPPELGDFVVVEQRGVGYSSPRLDCPGTYSLPFDRPLHWESVRSAHRRYMRYAVSFWQEQGVKLSGLDVRNMAADVDALRKALGYEHINLIGSSFGSHHALAIMRDFGASLSRAVLSGIEGPDHTIKLPSSVQRILARLDRHLKKDARWASRVDSLTDLMADVLHGLARSPIQLETVHPKSGRRETIHLGKYDLQWITADGLGSVEFLKALPRRYWDMQRGNFEWLADQAARMRCERSSNLIYEAVDCASGATEKRKAQIREEAIGALLGEAINETVFEVCDIFGDRDLGDEFRGPLYSDIPVLLMAGSLDARTPVSNAKQVLEHLAHGQLLIVEGAAHDHATRGDHLSELANIRHSFLAGHGRLPGRVVAGFEFEPPT